MSQEKKMLRANFEDDVTFRPLAKDLKMFWKHRSSVIKVVFIFFVFALMYALQSKNYYSSSVTIVPVTEGKAVGGSLGGLASLAGINLGGAGSAGGEISPQLYPEITSSVPFRLELLNTKIKVAESDSLVSYQYYFEELYTPEFFGVLIKYTVGLPGLIIGSRRNSDEENIVKKDNSLVKLSKEQYQLIEQLGSQLSLNVNNTEGFVNLSITMPEPEAAAQMTLRAQELLQEYALQFKTQKSKEQLAYLEERFQEKEKEFNEKKLKLALFQDRNNNINSAVARTKLLQLQSEYDLAFTVYSELAKQLETQRLQVKKDTPIFTILKPVTIPNEKAGPKRSLILIGFTFFGFIVSLGYIYIKSLLPDLKKEWEKA